MKFAALLAFVTLSVSVSAVPLNEVRQQNNNGGFQIVDNGQAQNIALKNVNQKGSAYFLTNEPTGSFIVALDLQTDGKLKLTRATSTGGRGAHGVTNPNGPDALFSQGAIKASTTGQILVAVNAGSNTISMFSIDPKAPSSLKLVGGPVSSGGDFPVSVAINSKGDAVCVLNSGTVNGVNCYSVDKKLGLIAKKNTLRSLNQQNVSTPPSGPAQTPSHIIFSEDGKSLLVSVKGDGKNNQGFLAKWDIANNGSLSQNFQKLLVPQGGALPFGMTVIKGKNAVLATDAAVGFEVLDLSSARNNVKLSGKSDVVKITGQKATCWSAHSDQTQNFYLSDIGTSTVTEVNVDTNTGKGKVVKQYPLASGSSLVDLDIANFSTQDFLYVLAPGKKAIDVLQLNGPGGAKQIQTLDIGTAAQKAGLTLDSNNMQGMTVAVFNN